MNHKSINKILASLFFTIFMASAGYALAKDITLNMRDADIRSLIATVSEVTGENFIIDPRVKGKVTVISSKPLDAKELYKIFLSILEVHGFAVIKSGEVFKIVPKAEAKQSGIPTANKSHPGIGDEIVTRVVPIEFTNAQQLVPILRPLIPQQGHLAAVSTANALVISDTADNIERLLKIIKRIDKDSTGDIEVIKLNHASAKEVVKILMDVTKKESGGKKDIPTRHVSVVADERTNSVLLGGEKSQRLRLRTIIASLDSPTEAGGNTDVIYLRYADAKNLVPVLMGVVNSIQQPEKGKQQPVAQQSTVNILAEESTNALIISAPPDIMHSLKTVIEKLDVRRAQVLIEAVIAEVSQDKVAELGIRFRSNTGDNLANTSGVIGGTNLSANAPDSGNLSALNFGAGLTLGFLSGTTTLLDGTQILDITALIRALATEDGSNVLSTPSVLTLDNEEAEIVVGQNVPFVTGRYQTDDGDPNPFETIERHDVGIKLKVTPQINEGNTVKMNIEQEVSSVATKSIEGSSDLVLNKRSIKTAVIVDHSSIVVLGGLIEESLQDNVEKVPGLGDLPLVGVLFRSKRSQKVKTNLMVFMRPLILRDERLNDTIVGSKYNYMRNKQLEREKNGVFLMPDETVPVLPPVDQFLELPPPFEPGSDDSIQETSGNKSGDAN